LAKKALALLKGGPLLAQDLVLPPQPLQLRCHIFLAVVRRRLDPTLPAAIDPGAQGG
jgi:hypothetical protein